tara:strand:+ start:1249 stop:1674 length:426 start_codon:yes stop_codon:yes gene_type:complete
LADIYSIYADHNENVNAKEFAVKMRRFLDQMVVMGRMKSYRLTRAKLGFRSMNLPEFHIMMEFDNMQQLDDAMTSVIRNEENIEEAHVGFNQLVDVETIQHFLYRDFPDDLNKKPAPVQEKKYTTKDYVEATKSIDPNLWK